MPYLSKYNPNNQKTDREAEKLRSEIAINIKKLYTFTFGQRKWVSGHDFIETAGKKIGWEELVNGVEAVLDGWWTEGRFAREFSKALTDYLKVTYSVFVNSGSSANLTAFASLTSPTLGKRQIKPDDEVITVATAFPTTVNPVVQFGCVPVFVDIDLETLNIEISQIEKALSPKTKVIMIAHTQGNPFNLEKVMEFTRSHGLWLIEDCCDALGAEYDGKKVGSFGDLATFSFYPAHQITTGEGGAVVTNNPLLFKLVKSFRDWGRDCWCDPGQDNTCGKRFSWKFKNLPYGYDHKFVYSHPGYNLKFTDMQAAIGLAQMGKINQFIKTRRENYNHLRQELESLADYLLFQEPEKDSNPSWFGFMITLKPNCPFKLHKIVTYLNDHKIATRPLYCGNIVRQPYFENLRYRIVGDLENTDYVMEHTFWVGVHPNLTKKHMDYMVAVIKKFVDEKIHE